MPFLKTANKKTNFILLLEPGLEQ